MSDEIFLVCLHEGNLIGTKKQIKADIENNYGCIVDVVGDVLYRIDSANTTVEEIVQFQKFTDLGAL